MAGEPRLPTPQQVLDLAKGFGFDMSLEEAGRHAAMMAGVASAYQHIDAMPERRPPVKYSRPPGYRPAPADNPFNGWYWRMEIRGADEGLLQGEPVAIKDAICIAGIPMMNGSRVLEGYMPDIDATVVTRLLDAGAVIVGKTNAEDASFSGSGHTCAHGPVRNPLKPTHSPGGSSCGSAVVLATGQVNMALGGDQGGSIRIPAAWSGLYGLKPTYGLVPYTGCAMIEMTLDHVGPMGNSTADVARLLTVLAGPDPLDPRQRGVIPADYVRDYRPALEQGVAGLKIGIVKEGFGQPAWDDLGMPASEAIVDASVMAAAHRFEALGATVSEVSLPLHLEAPYIFRGIIIEGTAAFGGRGNGVGSNWAGYYNLGLAEALAHGVRTRPNDVGAVMKSILLTAEYMHQTYHGRYYGKAQNVRHLLTDAYDAALERYDLLVVPTVSFRAPPLPPADAPFEEVVAHAGNMSANTCQADVTGHPSMSVPCGMADGLPIGMQLTGRRFDDATVLAAAAAFEASVDWRTT